MSTPIITKCPHCHNLIELAKAGQPATGDGWRRIVTSEMHTTAAAPWSTPGAAMPSTDFATYEKRQPAREPNVQSDVVVPMLQAGLTGLAVGVPSAALMGLLGYTTGQAMITGAGLALAAVSVTWLLKMDMHTKLLWLVESATGRDVNGDGTTGQPPAPPAAPVRVELAQGTKTRLIDLPATDAQLCAIAQTVLTGGTFSRRGLAEIVSETEYSALKSAMLAGGLLASKGTGTTAGVELTPAGRAVLRRLVVVGGGGGAQVDKTSDKTTVEKGA